MVFLKTRIPLSLVLICIALTSSAQQAKKPQAKPAGPGPGQLFLNPPESAKPGVLWMWMGANVSKSGITKDLEALKEEGFNSTTAISLADVTNPWGAPIDKDPTPEVIAWTEPWWKLIKHAALESKRLGMKMGMFNGAGYATSGGTWITPDMSMQQLCWSQKRVSGGDGKQDIELSKPTVNPRANARFPTYNPKNSKIELPEIPERKTYYKDIAVMAMPARDTVSKRNIIDLTSLMTADGKLQWDPPPGDWVIYRFGHTLLGEKGQPAQWQASGFECDKMNPEAVSFHLDHVIGEIKSHLGSLVGTTLDHIYFDSYEENDATWTPKMREEFASRRGYDILPYLATFAGRTIEGREQTDRFRTDFYTTIQDLYRDVYFTIIAKKLKAANLHFLSEAYGGPWRVDEVLPMLTTIMGEFWTHDGTFAPYELEGVIAGLRKTNQNILAAEAFTGQPADSKWTETPAFLKPVGDEAFCAGVNKIIIHRFVEQPWDDKYLPGATMGQWGTHFDRTQTWWKPAKAFVSYLRRCSAVLQWGHYVPNTLDDFGLKLGNMDMVVKSIHRKGDGTDLYFVANTSHYPGKATCTFNVSGMQPELWDPVTGQMRDLKDFAIQAGKTTITMNFDDAQSFFIVFRKKMTGLGLVRKPNFAVAKTVTDINGPWIVKFDAAWGGPATAVKFDALSDWAANSDKGIMYYSGTAVYTKSFSIPPADLTKLNNTVYIDLGLVNDIAKVFINDKEAGIIWTAPWKIAIPSSLLRTNNQLRIEVTNVWANRLIGDEQEPADMKWLPSMYLYNSGQYLKEFPDWFLKNEPRPSKGRYCFTTWNYFDSHSKLSPSGLLGPVKITEDEY